MKYFVVGVVATHQRPGEIARLLRSLESCGETLGAMVIVDNSGDEETRRIVQSAACDARYLAPGVNLGCGGGLRLAETKAMEWFGDRFTHLWILDDDAEVSPGALDALIGDMQAGGAEAGCPMITDRRGHIGWFPGLLDAIKFRAIRDLARPEEFLAACGAAPVPFSWSTGVALLVSKRAVAELGFHRDDYWMRGEDLEYSLRITGCHRGIFVPRATVRHLPPDTARPDTDAAGAEYWKHAALLQNVCYTALRLRHGRRIARTIPGNYLRFLRTWSRGAAGDAARAFWLGAVLGKPAGMAGGDFFRLRCAALGGC
jgi:hypothetical protein